MHLLISTVSEPATGITQRMATRTLLGIVLASGFVLSQPDLAPSQPSPVASPNTTTQTAEDLNLDPALLEESPVLQRWLNEVPDVRSDIRHDPSFRTRLRLGYVHFPDADAASGLLVGVEDVFVGRTGITLSADYQTAFAAVQESYGADVRYYLLPLGGYVNIAPVLGYRSIQWADDRTDGVNIGIRVLLVPSRTGAADLAFTQTWVAPGTKETMSLSTLSAAYAVTRHVRLSTEVQVQHQSSETNGRLGIGVEWMF
jgi:hypothetical protein